MMSRRLPRSTPFPYTTLFRSAASVTSELDAERLFALVEQGERRGVKVRFWRVLEKYTTEAPHKLCPRSEEHTSELQSQSKLVCRFMLEIKYIYLRRARRLPGR